MTPHPKRRRSTMRQGRRRSTQSVTLPKLVECTNCHKPTVAHKACKYCHFYKGKKVK